MPLTTIQSEIEATARGGKYLTFALGSEDYGIEILKVREIFGYMEMTPLPHTPSYVKGVINLRGQVISVIDLRRRFDMPAVSRTSQTCIIVTAIIVEGRPVNVGIIVDRVIEVFTILGDHIQDKSRFGSWLHSSFVLGIGRVRSGVAILLDIENILAPNDSITPQLNIAANKHL